VRVVVRPAASMVFVRLPVLSYSLVVLRSRGSMTSVTSSSRLRTYFVRRQAKELRHAHTSSDPAQACQPAPTQPPSARAAGARHSPSPTDPHPQIAPGPHLAAASPRRPAAAWTYPAHASPTPPTPRPPSTPATHPRGPAAHGDHADKQRSRPPATTAHPADSSPLIVAEVWCALRLQIGVCPRLFARVGKPSDEGGTPTHNPIPRIDGVVWSAV
jgi:hypothetical protein